MLQAVNTRETRDGAKEIKYIASPDLAHEIHHWASTRLAPDPHAGGEAGDEYLTTSLYFDTADFAVYRRKGSFARSKYRIRRYGTSDVVFLERKLRTAKLLSKRRTAVPLASLAHIETLFSDPEWPGYWFGQRILTRHVAPVSQVAYHRNARVGSGPFGPLRLTFDSGITAQPCTHFGFDPPSGIPVIPTSTIIEMKYCVKIPPVFAELVERFRLTPAPISKYRLSLEALRDAGVRTGLRRIDLRAVLAPVAVPHSQRSSITSA